MFLCLLLLTFFGLSPNYRVYLFSEIHEIIFHGKGGYDWETVYNMPIWLRKFTFNKIKEWYQKEAEQNAANPKYLDSTSHNNMKNKMKDVSTPTPPTYKTTTKKAK